MDRPGGSADTKRDGPERSDFHCLDLAADSGDQPGSRGARQPEPWTGVSD